MFSNIQFIILKNYIINKINYSTKLNKIIKSKNLFLYCGILNCFKIVIKNRIFKQKKLKRSKKYYFCNKNLVLNKQINYYRKYYRSINKNINYNLKIRNFLFSNCKNLKIFYFNYTIFDLFHIKFKNLTNKILLVLMEKKQNKIFNKFKLIQILKNNKKIVIKKLINFSIKKIINFFNFEIKKLVIFFKFFMFNKILKMQFIF